MTPADFYRDEAARCRQRAERSSTPERAQKWEARVEEYLRLASELTGAEHPPDDAMPARRSRKANGALVIGTRAPNNTDAGHPRCHWPRGTL